ncbi:hypothetical protein Tco_0591669 [Tanacetum coccineum]
MAKKPEIILLSDSSEAVSASSDHVNAGAIENGNEGSSKPPSGSKEIYRPRSVPKSILEWYGYDSVADYHGRWDLFFVSKKQKREKPWSHCCFGTSEQGYMDGHGEKNGN